MFLYEKSNWCDAFKRIIKQIETEYCVENC